MNLNTREYVAVLRELIQEGHEVSMTISGSSMEPFLVHNRDKIYFRMPEGELKKGDMVFFQRDSGEFVMHRILHIKPDGFYLSGDHQTIIEGPIRKEQIFAKVVSVERNGVWLTQKNVSWRFYAGCWRRWFCMRKVINKMKRIVRG